MDTAVTLRLGDSNFLSVKTEGMDSKLMIFGVLCGIIVVSYGRRRWIDLAVKPTGGIAGGIENYFNKYFHVRISPNATVGHLKKVVKVKIITLSNITTVTDGEPVFKYRLDSIVNGETPYQSSSTNSVPFALTYKGKVLNDAKTLSDYKIKHGSSVILTPMN